MEEKRLDVTQSPTPPTAAGTPPGPKPKSVGPAVVVGTALEFFDFYLYASMAALVFGPIFFPSESSAVSTLAAFSTFAVGFLVRPSAASCSESWATRSGGRRC